MTTLVGTDRQIKWAEQIKEKFSNSYPDESLPEHFSAQFWIDNRNVTIEELRKAATTQVYSPCTHTYPKLMRTDIASLLMNMQNFAVLDTETSGLPTGKKKIDNPEIVEMSMVAVVTGEVLFDSLFRPKEIEAYFKSEARGMHAFTEEAYKEAPTFLEKWERIKHILSQYHLVAYNADFDFPMLLRTAHLWGLSVPRTKCTCAMELFQAFMTTESSGWSTYKLSEACEVMGIDQKAYGKPHTALADALVTRELLLRMRESFTDINTCRDET